MKITDIQICRVTLPTDRWLLVCVETDEGHRGWGEVTGSMDDHGLAALLELSLIHISIRRWSIWCMPARAF